MTLTRSLLSLPWLAAFLVAGCTVGSTQSTKSIQCRSDGSGGMSCKVQDGNDTGSDNQDSNSGVICSGDNCVSDCQTDNNGDQHCTTTCDNGMSCEQDCQGDQCTLSCSCPDQGGDTGGGDCQNTDDPNCGGDTGGGCQPGDPNCGGDTGGGTGDCQQYPDDPNCGGDTGGGTDCQQNPDDPNCSGDYCQQNPDDPNCSNGGDYCQQYPDDPECSGSGGGGDPTYCDQYPDDPECWDQGGTTP